MEDTAGKKGGLGLGAPKRPSGQAPRRERVPLASSPDLATLKRWLRRWTAVRETSPPQISPSARCSPPSPPAPHQRRSLASCSTPRPIAPLLAADIRSTSSTRPSSALISSLGTGWRRAADRCGPDSGRTRRRGIDLLASTRGSCLPVPDNRGGAAEPTRHRSWFTRRSPICSLATIRLRSLRRGRRRSGQERRPHQGLKTRYYFAPGCGLASRSSTTATK